ncbi:DUF859 family phage minor structural protein [Romboutsia ilealis]|uniref:DUF859 family phage minor structural protein n=1 Tax=Romboutsia ilealis TaxID=1115758 RepID=UPI0026F3A5D7|nr:DUF859 family phage minor structural protein [Romboutsia ilealis]
MTLRSVNSRAVSSNFPTSNKYIVYWIECIQNSQNIANNISNVTVKVWIKRTNTGYETYGSGTVYCTINGTQYSASLSSSQKFTSTPFCIFSKTLDIGHNSDGTKTLAMSSYISHSKVTSSSHSYNQTLTNIPRVSTFSLNTSNIILGSTSLTVTINKSSSSFTHKVYYKFGNINVLKYEGSGTSTSFTPNISDCSQIPNSISGTGQIVVETYNGNTKLGQNSANITLTVPDSVKPSFNSLVAELVPNGINTSYGYVQNKSQCKLSISGSVGSYGSNVTNYYISGGGFTGSNSVATTGVLTQSGSITFSAYVTDSRGRKSDTKTVTINVKEYSNPKITEFTAQRCLINGQLDEDGTYAKVYTNYIYSSLSGNNSITANVMYRKTGDSDFIKCTEKPIQGGAIAIGGGSLDTTFAYEVRLELKDNFTTIGQSVTVATSFVTLDFRKGGKGIAIGKASEKDGLFDINMNVDVKGNLTVNGKPVGANVDWNNVPSINVKGNIGMSGYMQLPHNGGSWISGATNGNIKGSKQSEGAYHPIISQTTSSNHKISLGGLGDSFGFHLYDANRTENGIDKYFRYNLAEKKVDTDMRLTVYDNWIYTTGNNGWYNSTHQGGWYMVDSTWVRSYNDKNVYTGGRIKANTALETRYIDSTGGNLDINAKGNTLFINANAESGANLNINRTWSGSQGSEISVYNSKGKGWGYLGNSENSFYRVYGAGGSVSARESKYDIQKYDNSLLYMYVKNLNVYGYRSISDERDENNNVTSTTKRSDMYLGCMVDELPTEAVFYDNEGGEGKAVDTYSYSTMILGAVKHMQEKVEILENENRMKDHKINELEQRLQKLEEAVLNGIN